MLRESGLGMSLEVNNAVIREHMQKKSGKASYLKTSVAVRRPASTEGPTTGTKGTKLVF